MFIKKYLLLCALPLFLFGESIVGKWEVDPIKTKQSIDRLSIKENDKTLLMFLSSAGFKEIECFKDKTCIQNALTDIDSCMGHFHWDYNNNDYTLTPYTDKLCPDVTSENKKIKININNDTLNFVMGNGSDSFSFIYSKIPSNLSKSPLNPLSNIQYNKIYKSKAVNTYSVSASSLLKTYFYLVFTDKTHFYSLVTTQSNISTINEIKNIIQKETEKSNLSAKEQLEALKNMPYSSDINAIRVFSTTSGTFDPNKDSIRSSSFNTYFKESDIKYSKNKGGFGIEWKSPRICEQITFMPNNTLSCNNGIQYTLLDQTPKILSRKTRTIQKNTIPLTKNHIVNIDLEAEKRKEKELLEKKFQDAIKDVM